MEFLFGEDRTLNISLHEGGSVKNIVQTNNWTISFDNRRHLLTIQSPQLHYEIITINHTVMVLLDIISGEKIFFVREQLWKEYLKANKHFVL